MSGGGCDGRKLTPDEARLWQRAMGNAKPLPGRGAKGAEGPTAEDSGDKAAGDKAAGDKAAETRPARPEPPQAAAKGHGGPERRAAPRSESQGGVDKRTAQRLRRGQLPVEGRLDLHGLTLAVAHRALDKFLAGAQAEGHRCVLVITGKGLFDKSEGVVRRPGEVGPLRREVPRWLAEPGGRARVLAWAPAQPRHGGDGALYVLLRRPK